MPKTNLSKTKPAVSIVVPVYNAATFLEQCINSILCQKYNNFELILVNDGSKDSSPAICDSYAKQDSRVQVIHQKNAGQTKARQAGVQRAKGEFICFVDGDDWLEPDYLSVLVSEAVESKADIVTCDAYYNFPNKQIAARQKMPAGRYDKQQLVAEFYPMMIFSGEFFQYGVYAAMWNKLVKSDLVRKNIAGVSSDIRIGEDGVTTFANLLDASKVSVLHTKPLYHYRINNQSLTQSYCAEQFSGAKLLIDSLRQISDQRGIYDLNSQLDYYLLHYVRFVFNDEFLYKHPKSFKDRRKFLRQILDDKEVVEVVNRVDFAYLSPEATKFYALFKQRKFNSLLTHTIYMAYKQRLRKFMHRLLKRY